MARKTAELDSALTVMESKLDQLIAALGGEKHSVVASVAAPTDNGAVESFKKPTKPAPVPAGQDVPLTKGGDYMQWTDRDREFLVSAIKCDKELSRHFLTGISPQGEVMIKFAGSALSKGIGLALLGAVYRDELLAWAKQVDPDAVHKNKRTAYKAHCALRRQ